MKPARPRLVCFAAFDGMRVLDLTGPLDAFAVANDLLAAGGAVPYRLQVVSERGGLLPTSSGLALATEPLAGPDEVIDTLIVAGGAAALREESNPAAVADWLDSQRGLVDWIAHQGPRVR